MVVNVEALCNLQVWIDDRNCKIGDNTVFPNTLVLLKFIDSQDACFVKVRGVDLSPISKLSGLLKLLN